MCFLSGMAQQQKGFLRWGSYRSTEQKWLVAKQVHHDPHVPCCLCSQLLHNHAKSLFTLFTGYGARGHGGGGGRGGEGKRARGRGAREPDWCHLGYVLFPRIHISDIWYLSSPLLFLWLVASLGWWYLILSLTRHVVLKSEILGYHKLLHSSLVRLQGT